MAARQSFQASLDPCQFWDNDPKLSKLLWLRDNHFRPWDNDPGVFQVSMAAGQSFQASLDSCLFGDSDPGVFQAIMAAGHSF